MEGTNGRKRMENAGGARYGKKYASDQGKHFLLGIYSSY